MTWAPKPEYLVCRDLQHAWKPLTAKKVASGYVRTLRCSRCGAIKDQTLDWAGYITGSTMSYPHGYLREGEGRLTKDDRAELRLGNLDA